MPARPGPRAPAPPWASGRLMQPWGCMLALAILLSAGRVALADGKYFRALGGEADPTIPYQRAVVRHRDGVETLIVESMVRDAGSEIGWVMPLPAEPTDVRACRPGTLQTAFPCIRPGVHRLGSGLRELATCWFLCALVWCAVLAVQDARGRRPSVGTAAVLLCFTVAVGLYAALGSLSAGHRGVPAMVRGDDLELLQTARAGIYDVAVFRGATGEPVRRWLTENGFAMPDAVTPVVDAYAGQGWCFAAARIPTDARDDLTPHPVRFVFPSAEAVYPMRLTGAGAEEALQLDLYVIAGQAAAARNLDRWFCDRYVQRHADPYLGRKTAGPGRYLESTGSVYRGERIRMSIGHPEISELLWEGCTLTHLRGELSPADMSEDVALSFAPAGPCRRKVFARADTTMLGHAVAQELGGLALIAATVAWFRHYRHRPKAFGVFTMACLAVAVAAGMATARLIPAMETGPAGSGVYGAHARSQAYARLLEDLIAEEPRQDFPAAWARGLAREAGVDSREYALDVPGGYELEAAPDAWRLTLYDHAATPTVFRIPRSPAPH